jgi:hypothetical protein
MASFATHPQHPEPAYLAILQQYANVLGSLSAQFTAYFTKAISNPTGPAPDVGKQPALKSAVMGMGMYTPKTCFIFFMMLKLALRSC